jgi:hypothetical protein
MAKGLSTALLILAGLYIFTNRKKSLRAFDVESEVAETSAVPPQAPGKIISGPDKPIYLPAPKIDPYAETWKVYAPTRTTPRRPATISISEYVAPGPDVTEEHYSYEGGEILADRDIEIMPGKNITNKPGINNIYVSPGFKPESGFGSGGLADM